MTLVVPKGWRWLPGARFLAPCGDPKRGGASGVGYRIVAVEGLRGATWRITAWEDEGTREMVRWTHDSDGWTTELLVERGNTESIHDLLWSPVPITQYSTPSQWSPDWTDDATIGTLIGQARRAQGPDEGGRLAYVVPPAGPTAPWTCGRSDGEVLAEGETEILAWIGLIA